jgi:hypothetical protein
VANDKKEIKERRRRVILSKEIKIHTANAHCRQKPGPNPDLKGQKVTQPHQHPSTKQNGDVRPQSLRIKIPIKPSLKANRRVKARLPAHAL